MTPPLPLIPATVVGSHGKAGWWYTAVKAYQAGELGPGDLEEMFDDAADTAIRDMERAGLDIITDGEVRRLDGYVDSYYAIIKGIEPLPVRRRAGPWGYDQQTRYEAVGRIETPAGGLGIVKEFEYLKAHTSTRTKATCAGPLTFGSRIHPGGTYKGVVDVAEDRAGRRAVLLAQSYMPAQDIHVLRNPKTPENPWYVINGDEPLTTPEWDFAAGALRRFSASGCPK